MITCVNGDMCIDCNEVICPVQSIYGDMKNMKEKTQEKKETKQTTFDIETYISDLEKKIDKGFVGKITEINPITNTLYFKGEGGYDEKDGIAVTVAVDGETNEFSNWFSVPNARGYEKSNLYLFKRKYGSVPKVNMVVDVFIDDDGFYRIKY